MNQLQNKLLEMLEWLSIFLDKHGLRYYVVAGTMLGAIRHNGFIPWDDDVDIALPRKDYNRLIELLSTPIDHYVVEAPSKEHKDFIYSYAKFYDTNTTLVEDLRKKVVRGVFIDVFPLDGIGDTYEEAVKNYKKIDRYNMLLAMKTSKVRKDRKWWKNIAVIIGLFVPVRVSKLIEKLNNLCLERDYDESNYVGNLMSTYRYKEIIDKKLFGTPTNYKFEGVMVKGPELYDKYLSHLYGDWHQLPPEDKRKTAHDFLELDYEKPYLK